MLRQSFQATPFAPLLSLDKSEEMGGLLQESVDAPFGAAVGRPLHALPGPLLGLLMGLLLGLPLGLLLGLMLKLLLGRWVIPLTRPSCAQGRFSTRSQQILQPPNPRSHTYMEYIHGIHTQNTYMEHMHKSLRYFECLPLKNRSSGDVIFFSGILSMRSIILDAIQGLKSFRINTF